MKSIRRIVHADGCIVADTNNRTGKRRMALRKDGARKNWGRSWQRKLVENDYGKIKDTPLANVLQRSQYMKLEVSKAIFNGTEVEAPEETKNGDSVASGRKKAGKL